MERVVYILGAGFSRELGLPLMSDFLERSKDLHYSGSDRFKYFKQIFAEIDRMAVGKTYLELDLLNIEEILSVITTRRLLTGTRSTLQMTKFINDVILELTPSIKPISNIGQHWYSIFDNNLWRTYLALFSELFGVRFSAHDNYIHRDRIVPGTHYSFISLNYDLVVESAVEHLGVEPAVAIRTAPETDDTAYEAEGYLAKLHGCVRNGGIVPPTWNKGALDATTLNAWKLAQELLSRANQVRIIGYSLPSSDAYFTYLLKNALVLTTNLKHIDAICLDPNGTVEERYRNAFSFRKFKFASIPLKSYLDEFSRRDSVSTSRLGPSGQSLFYNFETDHHRVMTNADRPRTQSRK